MVIAPEACATTEQPAARCQLEQWRLVCEGQGAGGAGPNGSSGADPGASAGTSGEGGSAGQLL
jgi:hypothetical protein